jgi:uncharacterized protein YeeX (DUF496 family)
MFLFNRKETISCLSRGDANKLKGLDLDKLLAVNREDRLSIFANTFGIEKAQFINERFENDLLFKNQKRGLLNWVNNNRDIKPKFYKEIIRKISELEKPLIDDKLDDFMNELAELSIGIGVTMEEKNTITDFCNKLKELQTKINNGDTYAEDEYLRTKIGLDNYIELIKRDN